VLGAEEAMTRHHAKLSGWEALENNKKDGVNFE